MLGCLLLAGSWLAGWMLLPRDWLAAYLVLAGCFLLAMGLCDWWCVCVVGGEVGRGCVCMWLFCATHGCDKGANYEQPGRRCTTGA